MSNTEPTSNVETPVNVIVAGVRLPDGRLGIGNHGTIPWHLPEDLRYFRQVTLGHTVIMGRRTWESIPEVHRPLPGRTNIVVSRSSGALPGALVFRSLEEALEKAIENSDGGEVFIIGGVELYRTYFERYLPSQGSIPPKDTSFGNSEKRNRLYLTTIKQGDWPKEYDAYFDLNWVPDRILISGRETPSATYEVYRFGLK